ncbi:rhodanese-like domain-containing protein [Ilumatobacter sp.]|uniref:rhodanese-like domain-containing protein n=1 Tax=Ilumatobacter sp. TaxID=1967498 RepID=UPI003C5E119D
MTQTLELPDTDVIDAARLAAMIATDPSTRILDVRSGGEFDGVHIAGSYNVPLDTLGEHVGDLASVEHPVVLVCASGARADRAHAKLTEAGKQQLHLLEGGLDAWIGSGGDVVRGSNATWAMDRQVRFVAGAISLAGLLLSTKVPKAKWLAGGVATGLTFSALSNTCAMGNVLARLPHNRGRGCDVESVLAELRAAS